MPAPTPAPRTKTKPSPDHQLPLSYAAFINMEGPALTSISMKHQRISSYF
ncbi:hypothetical protein I315_02475 [Cryptococcus gattii Ru294]|nr:hypothetical protein I315_02475 [Cryptococcus gattii Ru294]